MSSGVRLEGFDEFKNKVNSIGGDLPPIAHAIVTDLTLKWKDLAIKTARNQSNRTGKLIGGITTDISPIGKFPIVGQLSSSKLYSPYVEWGTIKKVSVPSDLQSYALQFKGRGIKKSGGMSPRPFFFIHKDYIELELRNRLKDLFK